MRLPGFTGVDSDQQNNGLQVSLVYDRLTASRLGITPQIIDNTLYDAFGQAESGTTYTRRINTTSSWKWHPNSGRAPRL